MLYCEMENLGHMEEGGASAKKYHVLFEWPSEGASE